MANPYLGEVSCQGGVLRFDWNGLADLRDEYGEDYLAVVVTALLKSDVKVFAKCAEIGFRDDFPVMGVELDVDAVGAILTALALSITGDADGLAKRSDPGQPIEGDEFLLMESAALRAGVRVDEFWRQTPAQTKRILDRFAEAEFERATDMVALAYQTAVFTRAKRLGPFSQYRPKKRAAKPADIGEAIKDLARQFGANPDGD